MNLVLLVLVAALSCTKTSTLLTYRDGGAEGDLSDVGDPIVGVAAGDDTSCSWHRSGAAYCWGKWVGDDIDEARRRAPVAVYGLDDVVDISVGEQVCAVRRNGTVWCWGTDLFDLGGMRASPYALRFHLRPVQIPLPGSVAQVSVAFGHACAVLNSGELWCWGFNQVGQLGRGFISIGDLLSPGPVRGLTGVVQVSVGHRATCAVDRDGRAFCWGDNETGSLGDPEVPNPLEPLLLFSGVAEVQTSHFITCARLVTGDVVCVGGGGGTARPERLPHPPTPFSSLHDVRRVWMEPLNGETCFTLENGTAECGRPAFDRAGELTLHAPQVIPDAVQAPVAHRHQCALRSSGEVACWGDNYDGQVGDGSPPFFTATGVRVEGITDAVEVAGSSDGTCARRADGEVLCWGYFFPTSTIDRRPTSQPLLHGAERLAAIADNTCAIVDGSLTCIEPGSVPADLGPVVQADSDTFGPSCVVRATGVITCWGPGRNGALGNGSETDSTIPVDVLGIDDGREVSVAGSRVCASRASGHVSCWGSYALWGTAPDESRSSSRPVEVPGLTGAVQVSVGYSNTCARTMGGGVWCWGDNSYGELGDGTMKSRAGLLSVALPDAARDIAVGSGHVCAVTNAGEVLCWGQRSILPTPHFGEEPYLSPMPTRIMGAADAVQVIVGTAHACARTAGGEVYCWGDNRYGQLGDGRDPEQSEPVVVEIP